MTRNLKLILLFFELNFTSCCYETIITDNSKDGDTAGSACATPSETYKSRLPDNAFFSAAVKAIDLALVHIEQSRNTDFIIFSDSLSVLQSLHNRHIENPLLLDVLLKHNDLADLIIVGQGPIALAVGAGGGCLDIFSLIYHFSFLSPSLWETA